MLYQSGMLKSPLQIHGGIVQLFQHCRSVVTEPRPEPRTDLWWLIVISIKIVFPLSFAKSRHDFLPWPVGYPLKIIANNWWDSCFMAVSQIVQYSICFFFIHTTRLIVGKYLQYGYHNSLNQVIRTVWLSTHKVYCQALFIKLNSVTHE